MLDTVRRVRRRHRRQSLTFLLIFGLTLGLGAAAYLAYAGRIELPLDSGRPAPLPTCPPLPAPTALPYDETNINVFNATNRRGLALTVARELQKRGFRVPAEPRNDDSETTVKTAAVIRHGPGGLLAARTVASVVDGPVTLTLDDRGTADVDLVLGPTFTTLTPATAGPPAPVVAPKAARTCQAAPEPTQG